jgi:hypothetical protein
MIILAIRGSERNLIGPIRQPFLLAPNELRCDSTAREPDSKPKDGVVPSLVNGCDIKRGELGMLCSNQRTNQTFVDLDFRWWGTTVHVEILKEILCRSEASSFCRVNSHGHRLRIANIFDG